jgi:hypothetical protein
MTTYKVLEARVGALGEPGKMPCYSHGIPARECNVGGRLVKVKGSTCSECYALDRGNYRFDNVKDAQYRRLAAIARPDWVPSMAELITKRTRAVKYHPVVELVTKRRMRRAYFRWHDSGDIQDLDHLTKIVEVCRLTPNVRHWLPTREYRVVGIWQRLHGEFPENLIVRLSAHMVDKAPPITKLPTSTVHNTTDPIGHLCPAPTQDNNCGNCRACWTPTVANVSYHKH